MNILVSKFNKKFGKLLRRLTHRPVNVQQVCRIFPRISPRKFLHQFFRMLSINLSDYFFHFLFAEFQLIEHGRRKRKFSEHRTDHHRNFAGAFAQTISKRIPFIIIVHQWRVSYIAAFCRNRRTDLSISLRQFIIRHGLQFFDLIFSDVQFP